MQIMPMQVTLRWVNKNVGATTVRVYRGDEKFDGTALPSPMATLTNGETTYTDTTVKYGNSYWYMLSVSNGKETQLTPCQKFTVLNRRGIGPNVLQTWGGDERMGSFGKVPYDETFSKAVVNPFLSRVGYSVGSDRPILYKMIRNNKIYYVPTKSFSTSWGWDKLYASGLVGGDGLEGVHGDLKAQAQDAEFTHMGDKYRVLMPSGYNSEGTYDWSKALNTPTSIDGVAGTDGKLPSENNMYNDLFYPLFVEFPAFQRTSNLFAGSSAPLYIFDIWGANNSNYANKGVLCKEHSPTGSKHMLRGCGNANAGVQTWQIERTTIATAYDWQIWLPIFELVEE